MTILDSVVTGELIINTVIEEFAEESPEESPEEPPEEPEKFPGKAEGHPMGGIPRYLLRTVGKKYGLNHRWELPVNYPGFTVVMVIYH